MLEEKSRAGVSEETERAVANIAYTVYGGNALSQIVRHIQCY